MALNNVFRRVLNKTDLGLTATTLSTTQFLEVANFTVPAQQVIAWGANERVNGGVQGTPAKVALSTNVPAAIGCVIRLVVTNATQTRTEVIIEERSERFSASSTDRNLSVLLQEAVKKAGQDSQLKILVKGDAASLISIADSVITIPVTVYQ